MNKPHFTDEQIAYLTTLLRPLCCHTTGMHSPTHYQDEPAEFCESQRSKAWERVVAELGLDIGKAVSGTRCGRCADARKQAGEERNVKGLYALELMLTACARHSRETTPPEVEPEGFAEFRGARVSFGFTYSHRLQDHGECSYIHIRLPRFDPAAPIPADGYPRKRGPLTEEEKTAIRNALTDAGGVVLTMWGGSEWLSIGLECAGVTARSA